MDSNEVFNEYIEFKVTSILTEKLGVKLIAESVECIMGKVGVCVTDSFIDIAVPYSKVLTDLVVKAGYQQVGTVKTVIRISTEDIRGCLLEALEDKELTNLFKNIVDLSLMKQIVYLEDKVDCMNMLETACKKVNEEFSALYLAKPELSIRGVNIESLVSVKLDPVTISTGRIDIMASVVKFSFEGDDSFIPLLGRVGESTKINDSSVVVYCGLEDVVYRSDFIFKIERYLTYVNLALIAHLKHTVELEESLVD